MNRRPCRVILGYALGTVILTWTFASTARAADIVYNVDLTGLTQTGLGPQGTAGSAIGTITTDGTIGALGAGDVVDWSITVSNGVNTALVLAGPDSGNNSTIFAGSGVSATATQITYAFGAPSGVFGFEGGGGAVSPGIFGFLCLGPSDPECAYPSAGYVIGIDDGSTFFAAADERDSPESGVQVIASTSLSAVPEPRLDFLICAVFLALSLTALRRRTHAAEPGR